MFFFSGLELHFIDKKWLKVVIFKVSALQQQNTARHSRIRIRAGISAGITVSVSLVCCYSYEILYLCCQGVEG